MSANPTPTLFQPIQVGELKLAHRAVMAPMTRYRADTAHVHTDMGVEYYSQRASVPGSLIITEPSLISGPAGGIPDVPGIWNDEQITAWKKISDAVHKKGSYVFMQQWALGRAARLPALKQENADYPYVSASPVALSTSPDTIPRELSKEEIQQYVEWWGIAAANAVHKAGLDGVEIHGANGYLVDQFLQDVSNKRADEYGGSIENRARFALEVLDSVVAAIGQKKTGIRLSPWSKFQDMRMDDPVPTFTYLVERIKEKYPDLAYVHVVSGNAPFNEMPMDPSMEDFICKISSPIPAIHTGGYDREKALNEAEKPGRLIGFARSWLSNPDFVFRLRHNLPLNSLEVDTLYLHMNEKGYTTYPFSEDFLKSAV